MTRRIYTRPHKLRRAVTEDGMNATERAYMVEVLQPQVDAGVVLQVDREGVTLRLPGGVRYTADFVVVREEDGMATVELHEVKGDGVWTASSWQKFKIATGCWSMFRFVVASGKKRSQRDGGGYHWTTEVF